MARVWYMNMIISEVEVSGFLIFFLALKKVLAALESGIGTCSVFCHSFSFQNNVPRVIPLGQTKLKSNLTHPCTSVFYPICRPSSFMLHRSIIGRKPQVEIGNMKTY